MAPQGTTSSAFGDALDSQVLATIVPDFSPRNVAPTSQRYWRPSSPFPTEQPSSGFFRTVDHVARELHALPSCLAEIFGRIRGTEIVEHRPRFVAGRAVADEVDLRDEAPSTRGIRGQHVRVRGCHVSAADGGTIEASLDIRQTAQSILKMGFMSGVAGLRDPLRTSLFLIRVSVGDAAESDPSARQLGRPSLSSIDLCQLSGQQRVHGLRTLPLFFFGEVTTGERVANFGNLPLFRLA